ncbi:hypothetical protein RAJCM14343_5824 [Rhodococcus aetherivorans]|uniref:Uncharacterized protein n=1 Tax=Rhodococcus aetherivorans TaxID=191292 RepID=A0ABQ0YVC7_9NOCA|nr:hypothetical protein [Rhodococcus aetherivorans]ETT26259.1 hypothetical protein RR21198_3137 [Rhodococcus rhodochrous ATCC 21198]NGP25856.1 hypothetical protein [Rhodococcus aetherivorans]GES40534.1 hypothetical protein RAJCM14343_5824 [Rhodococcus aetherivorans]
MSELPNPYGPERFSAALSHHGVPMTFKSARTSWEGDYELHILRFVCDCGLTAEVHTRELDGGPEMLQRRQGGQ